MSNDDTNDAALLAGVMARFLKWANYSSIRDGRLLVLDGSVEVTPDEAAAVRRTWEEEA